MATPAGAGMMDPVAGLVIVHFGDPEPTLRCLASVAADGSRIERRVVVVDNSGNMDAGGFGTDARLLTRPENPGFGAAANLGLDSVDRDHRCSLYLVLNNDAMLASGFIDAAAGALEVGVGAAGGPIQEPGEPSRLWYAGGRINFLTGTAWQRRSAAAASRRREVGFIPGTAVAIAPRAWREVGGFDPRFFLYNEDVDLCLRLRRAGWRLMFEPGMVCSHALGGATGSADRSPLYLENITRTRLLPFSSRLYRVYLGGIHTLYNSLRVIGLCARRGAGCKPYVSAVVRGHMAALRGLFSL
jgi:GT2 family glycosyltransferase